MQQVVRTLIVPYTQAEMFDLVADVERYPEFIRWCTGVRLSFRTEEAAEARFGVQLGPFSGSFSARAEFQSDRIIRLTLLEGLFSSFEGLWTFESCPRGTRVTLDLRFQFGKGVGLVAEPFFRRAGEKLVDAFEERAAQLYGSKKVPPGR